MSVTVRTKSGKTRVLLNPSEKAGIYAAELKANASSMTGADLSKNQRAYRSGYLDARRDNARAWKHNQKKKK